MTEKTPTTWRSLFTPRNLVKLVVGGSTHFVVSTVIYKLVEPEDKSERAKTFVGSHAIAGLVTAKVTERIDEQFDDLADQVAEIRQAVEEAQTETVPDPTP